MDRKGMKANARKAYKRHYWMIVVICLFASVFGVAYSSSTWSVNASSPSATVQEDGTAQSDNVPKVLENLLVGDESQARRQVEHNQEQIVQNDTNAMMGRKRGVFASLLNSFSSGSVSLSMADAAKSIVHNDGVAVAVPIVVSLAVYLFVWLFVQQTYRVVMMRMLLEGADLRQTSREPFPLPNHHAQMVVDGEGDAARERVPVPVDVHHHRRVHQTVFLPYDAVVDDFVLACR